MHLDKSTQQVAYLTKEREGGGREGAWELCVAGEERWLFLVSFARRCSEACGVQESVVFKGWGGDIIRLG